MPSIKGNKPRFRLDPQVQIGLITRLLLNAPNDVKDGNEIQQATYLVEQGVRLTGKIPVRILDGEPIKVGDMVAIRRSLKTEYAKHQDGTLDWSRHVFTDTRQGAPKLYVVTKEDVQTWYGKTRMYLECRNIQNGYPSTLTVETLVKVELDA